MPLPSKVLQFPLYSGVQEGTDPRTAKPGLLVRLKNCAWTKDGRLDTRAGTSISVPLVTSGPSVTGGARLFTRENELCLIDSVANLYSYSPLTSAWSFRGHVPEVGLTWDPSVTSLDGIQASDVGVTSDGKIIQAWVSGDPSLGVVATSNHGLLSIRVLDSATGAVLSERLGLASADYCRVVTSGTSWAVVYNDPPALAVRLVKSDLTSVTLLAEGIDAAIGYSPFDVVAIGSTIVLCTARVIASKVRVSSWTFAGIAVVAPVDVELAVAKVSAIGIGGVAGQHLFIAYAAETATVNSKVRFAAHDPATLAQTLAPMSLDTVANATVARLGVCRASGTTAVVAWSIDTISPAATCTDGEVISSVVTTGGVVSSRRGSFFQEMLSRPFVLNGRFYMFLCDKRVSSDVSSGSDAVNTLARQYPGLSSSLVEIEINTVGGIFTEIPHRYVGRIDARISGVWRSGHAAAAAAVSATTAYCHVPTFTEAPQSAYQLFQGFRPVTLTSAADLPEDMWTHVDVAGEAYLAAGYLTAYAGHVAFDYGFPRPCPVGLTRADNGNSVPGFGAFMVDGSYLYATIPMYVSPAGILHRGPISPEINFALAHGGANDNKLDLAIIPQTLGAKLVSGPFVDFSAQISHLVYRTAVGGSALHRRQDEPLASSEANYPFGSPNVFHDTESDAQVGTLTGSGIATRPLPYTASELDDVAPPSALTVHLHKNRLWIVAGDHETLWFSKDRSESPQIAPGFHPDFTIPMGRRIVGLATMDDKLVVLCEDAIFYIIGDGPAANGDGSDYSIVRVQADVGCTSARSIVSEPNGVMFLSQRGIYRLTRALELQWVGKPVRDTLAAYPVVTSGVVVHALNQIRFTCTNVAGTEGVVLVFDHDRGQWSVFEYSYGVAARIPIVDALVYGGTYTMLHPSGYVFFEDTSTYLDAGGAWIETDVETADVFGDGPLSYQRLRRFYIMGERLSDCDVTLRVAVRGAATYDQVRVWRSDEVAHIGSAKIGVHVKSQKADQMRFRITVTAPSAPGVGLGSGQGINLSALGFEIAPKRGIDKRPAEARK